MAYRYDYGVVLPRLCFFGWPVNEMLGLENYKLRHFCAKYEKIICVFVLFFGLFPWQKIKQSRFVFVLFCFCFSGYSTLFLEIMPFEFVRRR